MNHQSLVSATLQHIHTSESTRVTVKSAPPFIGAQPHSHTESGIMDGSGNDLCSDSASASRGSEQVFDNYMTFGVTTGGSVHCRDAGHSVPPYIDHLGLYRPPFASNDAYKRSPVDYSWNSDRQSLSRGALTCAHA